MRKIVWLIILIASLILLIAFFYPKTNTLSESAFTAEMANKDSYTIRECTCIGIKMQKPGLSKSSVFEEYCFGVPINCKETCFMKMDTGWEELHCSIVRGK